MKKLNIRGLEINFLLVFNAMMRELSVTAAGQALGLSQPNVSYAIKKLREFFSDELFVRTAGKMQPTARALELDEPIARIISILREEVLAESSFSPGSSDRKFVINTTDIGEITFIPKIIQRFRQVSSGLKIESVCLEPQELIGSMRSGRVDLAIGHFPELTARTLYSQGLGLHPLVCLAREGNPHTRRGLTAEEYSLAEHVGLVGEGHSQRNIEERISKSKASRRIAFLSHNFMSIPFIVRDTDLIATVPKMLAVAFSDLQGIQAFQPPFEIDPIPIKQYWTESQHNDPGQIWLRRLVAEMFINNDPTQNIILT